MASAATGLGNRRAVAFRFPHECLGAAIGSSPASTQSAAAQPTMLVSKSSMIGIITSSGKSWQWRRTNEDKQRAVKAALAHAKASGLSDSAIARHVGVSQRMVSEWRGESSKKVSKIDPSPELRTVTRNGVTYQQNVTRVTGVTRDSVTAESED